MKRLTTRLITLWLLLQSAVLFAAEIQPRIIGGEEALPGEWPATAALLSTTSYNNALANGSTTGQAQFLAQYCGGALVAPNWVMTAAHCLFDGFIRFQPADVLVLAGVTRLTDESGQLRVVTNIIINPNYNATTFDSDIALLELASVTVAPAESIALYQGDPPVGTDANVVGWGDLTNGTRDFPDTLQEAVLQVISTTACNASTVYNGGITDNMLCATAPGKDSCGGDSGGPLMAFQDGVFKQIGIVSFGNECALPGFPGVYTRVARFDTWVNDTMAGVYTGGDGGGGAFGWLLLIVGMPLFLRRLHAISRLAACTIES